ncbi:MAG: ParA family protein [Pseudomonadota bacterium]
MGRIICITARKDGAGKTTTAINLSAAFSIAEKKTLLVDCDPIGHAATGLGVDETLITNSLYQGMTGKVPITKLIINKGPGYPNLIPGKLDLYRFPLGTGNNKESVLRNLLAEVKEQYDYIVIDTPQTPVILMINAFVAAELLLVTIPCEYLSLAGFGYLFDTFQMVKKGYGLKNDIAGILITKMNKQEKSSRLIAEELRNRFKNIIFDTSIPTCGKLRSSPAYGKPVFMTDIKSAGARSYLKLACEIMNKWENIPLKQ